MKDVTEAITSVAPVFALVLIQKFSLDFKIFQLKCPLQTLSLNIITVGPELGPSPIRPTN